ncbi:hypothetical protein EDB80DRAFT_707199 [Ilyonectria destructans]|nr:hypothetical protein EDB80DRAFT_707199 [Ilyonectria destructans]
MLNAHNATQPNTHAITNRSLPVHTTSHCSSRPWAGKLLFVSWSLSGVRYLTACLPAWFARWMSRNQVTSLPKRMSLIVGASIRGSTISGMHVGDTTEAQSSRLVSPLHSCRWISFHGSYLSRYPSISKGTYTMSSLILVATNIPSIPSRAAAWSVLRFAGSAIRLGITMLFVCLCLDQSAINQSIFTHNSPPRRTRLVHSTSAHCSVCTSYPPVVAYHPCRFGWHITTPAGRPYLNYRSN